MYLQETQHDYLLQVSLKDLHRQTLEWLSEISFWETELSLFRKMFRKKALIRNADSDDAMNIAAALNAMASFGSGRIPELSEMISVHERKLGRILENRMESHEEGYREEHHRILDKMLKAIGDFKRLKSQLLKVGEILLRNLED